MSSAPDKSIRVSRTTTRRAATTRSAIGDDSIDRATPRQRGDVWLLDWTIRLNDGRLVSKRSQASTKGEVRQRARATAAEVLATGASNWKTTSDISDYLQTVSRPAIEKARLRPNSRARYLLALNQLAGTCKDHRHADSLRGHSIATGTRFRVHEGCLQEIAQIHGSESARQARAVLSKYVLQQLIRDEVITGNPLLGMSIDLATSKASGSKQGGRALKKARVRRCARLSPCARACRRRRGSAPRTLDARGPHREAAQRD